MVLVCEPLSRKLLRSRSDWVINRPGAANFAFALVKPLDCFPRFAQNPVQRFGKQPRKADYSEGLTQALRSPKSLGADPTGQRGAGVRHEAEGGGGPGAREVSRRTFARTERDK